MSHQDSVSSLRQQSGWTQAALAERCGVSRAEVSGIETGRLVPSVLVAMRLADVLHTTVDELFGKRRPTASAVPWAWLPRDDEKRLWRATVNGKLRVFPIETTAAGVIPHDCLLTSQGVEVLDKDARPDDTLVIAG